LAKNPAEIQVEFIVRASTYVPVRAKTLEEAIEIARTYKLSDVATFEGEVLDGNVSVAGAYDRIVSQKVDS
jgi:hypothetical protein